MLKKEFIQNFLETSLSKANKTSLNFVVALSGGPDSVALAYLLSEIRANKNNNDWNICLAHLNHSLRDSESDYDELFCYELAEKLSLEIFSKKIDVYAYMKKHKISMESAARECRYSFLFDICRKKNASLLLAHHQYDLIETLIMNIDRGCGILGMSSIPEINIVDDIVVLRPLLQVSKDDLFDYLKYCDGKYVVDKSNNNNLITRNRYRNIIIPELVKIRDFNFIDCSVRMTNCAKSLWIITVKLMAKVRSKYIISEKDDTIVLSRNSFNDFNKSINREFLRYIVNVFFSKIAKKKFLANYSELTSVHVDNILKFIKDAKSGKTLSCLPGNIVFRCEYDVVVIEQRKMIDCCYAMVSVNSVHDFPVMYGNYLLSVEVLTNKIEVIDCDLTLEFFDKTKLNFPLSFDKIKDGDRFSPIGMNGSMLISDFFTNNKVSQKERKQAFKLVDANENILWLVPHRISSKALVDEKTMEILKLQVTVVNS